VLGADHRCLHEEKVGAGFGDGLAESQGGHWGGAHRRDAALLLDLGNPLTDQVFPHRLAVELLHQGYEVLLAHRCDAVEDGIGVVVAALDALQVQNA